VDLDDKATQEMFASLVGVNQKNISKHYQAGVLKQGQSYREWLLSYCERLRLEAGGRIPTDARERRDLAQAIESEVNAQMKMRQLYREDQLIVDLDTVRQAMTEWATIGKNEFTGAVDKIVTAIESEHGITVDRDSIQSDVETALRAIGSYALESGDADNGGAGAVGTAA
jgi:hypothetical protein